MSVLALVVAESPLAAYRRGQALGGSASFHEAVAQEGRGDGVQGLSFVAVLDVAKLDEDPTDGGAFEVLEKVVEEGWDASEELLHSDSLRMYFDAKLPS